MLHFNILLYFDIVNSFTNSNVFLEKYEKRFQFFSKKKGDQEEI